jgi:hypothetical protein
MFFLKQNCERTRKKALVLFIGEIKEENKKMENCKFPKGTFMTDDEKKAFNFFHLNKKKLSSFFNADSSSHHLACI